MSVRVAEHKAPYAKMLGVGELRLKRGHGKRGRGGLRKLHCVAFNMALSNHHHEGDKYDGQHQVGQLSDHSVSRSLLDSRTSQKFRSSSPSSGSVRQKKSRTV